MYRVSSWLTRQNLVGAITVLAVIALILLAVVGFTCIDEAW